MVSIPSPSQSPATGRKFGPPKVNSVIPPACFMVLSKNHFPSLGRYFPTVSIPSPLPKSGLSSGHTSHPSGTPSPSVSIASSNPGQMSVPTVCDHPPVGGTPPAHGESELASVSVAAITAVERKNVSPSQSAYHT